MRLTDVERRLVCGDPKTEGWTEVPRNQARYFLRSFLQQRGYHAPSFELEGDVLSVDPGRRSSIRGLTAHGLPPEIDPGKLRRIKGRPLTPKQLDAVKTALRRGLQNRGYACPEITLTADALTGEVVADVAPGRVHNVEDIEPSGFSGVDPAVFNRYEAFGRGRPFDMRLLSLSSERALADALFVSAYYDVSCSTGGALSITQRVVQGKPQLYQVGVGFDTEDLAIGKARWRNSRLGMRASTMEGTLYGSYREQSAEMVMRYYLEPSSRLHLRPRAYFKRQNELRFESLASGISVLPATSWENPGSRATLAIGPGLEYVRTLRGVGPGDDKYLVLRTQFEIVDHLFEYHAGEPREGWRMSFDAVSRDAKAYSSLTAHRLSLQGELLWNLGRFDPPLLVLGTRYWLATVIAGDTNAANRELPPDVRFFLGGDANLRGADRKELPGDGIGFLTAFYDGVELRMGEALPFGLQPLVFIDGAMAGRSSAHVDPDVYWSPGAGLRWRMPIGAIRATFARGFVWRREENPPVVHKPHWQFYFSFGREF